MERKRPSIQWICHGRQWKIKVFSLYCLPLLTTPVSFLIYFYFPQYTYFDPYSTLARTVVNRGCNNKLSFFSIFESTKLKAFIALKYKRKGKSDWHYFGMKPVIVWEQEKLWIAMWPWHKIDLLVASVALTSFAGGSVVKNPPASAGDVRDTGLIPGLEHPLEEGMATHPSVLACRIPWTEEPSGLQSMGSHRVGHDWIYLAHMRTWPWDVVSKAFLVLCPNRGYFSFVEAALSAVNIGSFSVYPGMHHQLLEQLCHTQHPWQQTMTKCLNVSKNRS